MPLGTYFTPGMTASEMKIVDGLVNSLDRDFAVSSVADRLKLEWAAFRDEWKTFYAENSGIIARSMNQTWVTTLEYRERVADWYKRFQSEGGKVISPEPPSRSKPSGFPWKGLLIVGGLVGAGWYFIGSQSKAEASPKAPRRRRK